MIYCDRIIPCFAYSPPERVNLRRGVTFWRWFYHILLGRG